MNQIDKFLFLLVTETRKEREDQSSSYTAPPAQKNELIEEVALGVKSPARLPPRELTAPSRQDAVAARQQPHQATRGEDGFYYGDASANLHNPPCPLERSKQAKLGEGAPDPADGVRRPTPLLHIGQSYNE